MKPSDSSPPKKKHKSIKRHDQESKRTHGWYVRVNYCGGIHSKFFSDKKNGGREASLEAAIDWRNHIESRIGKPRTDKKVNRFSRTKTRVTGVFFDEHRNHYHIRWAKPDGKQGGTSVSIRKYGKKAAFEKACKIRAEKEAERIGT